MTAHTAMAEQMSSKPGFIAALDQSGGSTPATLALYGIPENAYSSDEEMFDLMHAMRVRIMTAPAFTGEKVLGAILFEATMDKQVEDTPVPDFLWQRRGVVPFLKVDKGLEEEADGVRLMKPMPGLDALLSRAAALGVYGTKMRSVINKAAAQGIEAIVDQQFEAADRITRYRLMPIIEPEVTINIPDKADAERLLCDEIARHLDAVPAGRQVMLKLTIPTEPDLYAGLIAHRAVLRVVALSGGYSRAHACRLLAQNHGMSASFSRALVDDLRVPMGDAEFGTALGRAVDQIFRASTEKLGGTEAFPHLSRTG